MKLFTRRRTLQIAACGMLLFAVVAVWFGFHISRARAQRTAVAAIREYGGCAHYDFHFPEDDYRPYEFYSVGQSDMPSWLIDWFGVDFFHSVVQVNLNCPEGTHNYLIDDSASDNVLQYLPAFPKLKVLLLGNLQARDDSLRHVSQLTQLERVYMWNVQEVSDAGASQLANLKQLRSLHISGSKITDESLAVFGSFPLLEELSLQFNDFTDDGLKQLVGLKRLKSLWICRRAGDRPNSITDAGMRSLIGLTQLEELGIQDTAVTAAGVQQLAKELPKCKVYGPTSAQ